MSAMREIATDYSSTAQVIVIGIPGESLIRQALNAASTQRCLAIQIVGSVVMTASLVHLTPLEWGARLFRMVSMAVVVIQLSMMD